jgi:hypothetical protein
MLLLEEKNKRLHLVEVEGILTRQHIRWKPTSSCKLWKLQSESHDVDPTGRSEEVGGVICKITFANHASHLP